MVGLYFNTRNMSAILKALQNRKVEVELKSEVVEFAGVKDLDKKLKDLFKEQKVLDKKQPTLNKLKVEVEDSKARLKSRMSESEDVLNDFSKQAKELGVDPNSVSGYKALTIEVSNSKEYLK